jgi:hypothetical protein
VRHCQAALPFPPKPMFTLAQITQDPSPWVVVQSLGVLVMLALNGFTLVRGISGKGAERQVEPTQLSAIQADIKSLTSALADVGRTQAAQSEAIRAIKDTLDNVRTAQQRDVEGLYKRVNAISEDLAGVKARVGAVELRCPKC